MFGEECSLCGTPLEEVESYHTYILDDREYNICNNCSYIIELVYLKDKTYCTKNNNDVTNSTPIYICTECKKEVRADRLISLGGEVLHCPYCRNQKFYIPV